MSNPLCQRSDVKIECQITDDSADPLLDRLIGAATDAIQRKTGYTFGHLAATNEVWRAPEVTIDRNGTLRVRLRTPRITAVTACAVRLGTPLNAWTPIDLGTLDYDPDPTQASSLLRAYAGLLPVAGPVWAQLSYTAGWVGDTSDPYPADLQELAIWWTSWMYRTKDAPFEKTANPQMGTVIIPSAMPARLRTALERWTLRVVA